MRDGATNRAAATQAAYTIQNTTDGFTTPPRLGGHSRM